MHLRHLPTDWGRGLARLWLASTLLAIVALACTNAPSPTPTAAPSLTTTPTTTTTAGPTQPPTLYDFGDAPDPSYPTLLASNGARTRVIDQFWLGNLRTPSVTSETDANIIDRDELDDGLESYVVFGDETALTFRAVKSASAAAGATYFNLLIDLNRDGRWSGEDWVVRNREVDLAPGEQKLIDVGTGVAHDTWIRATLTDSPVADSAAGWDGTGEFAIGEVEDYYLPGNPPYTPPPPSYPPTPTPTYSPTPSPTPTSYPTSSHAPTPSPSPSFVYTGDFVVVCDPDPAAVVHGQSVTMVLKITSGQNTPPERFQARVAGGEEFGGGTVSANPAPGADGWSDWGDGASVTFTSTHVDPPARVERNVIVLTLQSLSTTRTEYCEVDVTHTAPSPTATQIQTPTITVEPEIVTLSLTSQVPATVRGTGFTPGARVDLRFKPSGHPAITATDQAGTDGQFSLVIHLQPGMPKGTWQVTATDRNTGQIAETAFTVR